MTFQPDQYMQQAVELARMGQGRTAPNPPVGAVVVLDGQVVGQGFHPSAGQPHAEIYALNSAADKSRGADLYVTLEPCCHQGRTGPCTEAIIRSGIARVFVGTQDPNPQVAGKGMQILEANGIEVVKGVLEVECARLIAPFAKHLATGLPYVVYKAAMTLDGKTATIKGDSKWISCAESRQFVHQLRNRVDAIAVGSGTVAADNPRLTTRVEGAAHDAVRVVFDGQLTTSPQATVYCQESEAKTVLVTSTDHAEQALEPYRTHGVDVVQVDRGGSGLDLRQALLELGKRNLQYLLLEGGGTLAAAMLKGELIDRVMFFVAPKLVGGSGKSLFCGNGSSSIDEAINITDLKTSKVGQDILIEGEVQYVHRVD